MEQVRVVRTGRFLLHEWEYAWRVEWAISEQRMDRQQKCVPLVQHIISHIRAQNIESTLPLLFTRVRFEAGVNRALSPLPYPDQRTTPSAALHLMAYAKRQLVQAWSNVEDADVRIRAHIQTHTQIPPLSHSCSNPCCDVVCLLG